MKKAYESIMENRLKAFDNMLEGVAIHEVIYDSFNEAVDYIIIDVNPAYEDITGFKKENVLGKKASTIYNKDTPPYIEIYSKVAMTGEPEHFEAYFEPMDKYFQIVVTSPEKGKFATFFEDISEYKTTEKKLKKVKNVTV
ncbi:PAS domain S-box protein [Methanobacterium sp.]|uniref:PAS domain S-box protein n=1 Tax=Methanobacterium sp. TaxID=2164 RepID=UPI003C7162EE